jgi:flagellar biosynthesis/type III secretory pathway protein FliH
MKRFNKTLLLFLFYMILAYIIGFIIGTILFAPQKAGAYNAQYFDIECGQEKIIIEAKKIVTTAQQEIENQRKVVAAELKTQVGQMAIEIAEKVLRQQLASDTAQEAFVNKLVDDIKLN